MYVSKENLIEKLVKETGCDCLSDLRLQLNKWLNAIIDILSTMEAKSHNIEEWQEAVSYLTDTKIDISGQENEEEYARNYLIDFLKSKKH